MTKIFKFAGFCAVAALFLEGCASTPSYEDAFSSGQQIHGSMESIPAPMERTWVEAMGLLSQQGFIVQSADEKSHIILMTREMRDQKDKDFSYTISATLTFVPMSGEITRVMVAANQSTELHRKQYDWWHLLWLIPIFPVGSTYTTVVVNRDTVRSPQFYHDFFDGLMKSVAAARELDAPPTVPAKPSPATPPQAAPASVPAVIAEKTTSIIAPPAVPPALTPSSDDKKAAVPVVPVK